MFVVADVSGLSGNVRLDASGQRTSMSVLSGCSTNRTERTVPEMYKVLTK